MSLSHIQYLVQGYLADQLTEAELEEFVRLAQDEQYSLLLQDAISQALANPSLAGYSDASRADQLFQRILTAAGQAPEIYSIPPARKTGWRRLAAAAIILAAAGTLTWYLLDRPHSRQQAGNQQTAPATDALPGGEKATLTLADGSIILLDSAANGALAQEGAVKITKKDGHLTYQFNNSIPADGVTAYNTIATPRGGQYVVSLPDGSRVWLNAASSLRFPAVFPPGQRKVELKGEAYFEVRANTANPFVVSTGETAVEVLGTIFNVMAYTNEHHMVTTLLDGRLKVKTNNAARELAPGKAALVPTGQDGPIKITAGDPEAAMAWRNGYFHFDHTDIRTIMRQIQRWYDVEPIFETDAVKPISGSIPRNVKLSKLLDMLEQVGDVKFIIENKTVRIRS
ncbi:MAG: FecR domain-containing protein [Candidatus Pseudobacter hemicellulosilyticus]|uniref:FecR domain-containing protein n=1 Tax=Candidatus Pseudobacter hemicellulosilyticus TaxID=3121375 RepID=A0AAJ5WTY8_9BACT|nr:MAG: FecR domain-containing protein [Pseudobacter sp.]